jgi:probable H4MPT-linked C1 transfer pathway protein
MATPVILGLDIGGANLKAATHDRRAVSVPFPLWKQPDKLPAALAELVGRFPDAEELAVTMTGELCDCFETKRQGVDAILRAVANVSRSRTVRVWSTAGVFLTTTDARENHLKVAAANWHALATFAGRFAPHYGGLLLDIGSTTTDIIPLDHGVPSTYGLTDQERLEFRELVYVGVRRTPVCALLSDRTMAELFATTQDVYVVMGLLPEDPMDRDTADGRPLTAAYSKARLARMLGADTETLPEDSIVRFATRVHDRIVESLSLAVRAAYYDQHIPPDLRTVIASGAGEFLVRPVIERELSGTGIERTVSLNDELGAAVSACAPAYAVAVLATELRPAS